MFVKVPGVKLKVESVSAPKPAVEEVRVTEADPMTSGKEAPMGRQEKFFIGITDETRVDL